MRLYALAKAAPALLSGFNVLDEPAELLLEVEAYTAEEARAESERHARERRAARSAGSASHRVAGRRRR